MFEAPSCQQSPRKFVYPADLAGLVLNSQSKQITGLGTEPLAWASAPGIRVQLSLCDAEVQWERAMPRLLAEGISLSQMAGSLPVQASKTLQNHQLSH